MKEHVLSLKKLLVMGAVFVASTSIARADMVPYLGASVGVTANTVHTGNLTSFRGMPFNAFIGYGGLFDPSLYLATELIGTVTTGVLDNGQLKSTTSYGLSVLPGLLITNQVLTFLRFSILRARFSTLSTTVTGGEAGLGFEVGLMQSMDIRAEYDFIGYRSIGRDNASGSPQSDQFNLGILFKFG